MKRLQLSTTKLEPMQLKEFKEDIQAAILRGESLEQLAERIGEDTVPNFYGANFRAAYNEGIEAGSAYGYEQPLDLYENIKMDFNSKEPVTVEAEFEVIESKTGATFICEVQQVGGKRCVVQCDTCRNNEGQLIGGIPKDPGEDIIQTPLGEMTVRQWDLQQPVKEIEDLAFDWGYNLNDKEDLEKSFINVSPENYEKLLLGNWKAEPEITKPKKGTYLVCPKCENPFPHSHTDGSFSCEECGKRWINED